MQSKDEKEYYGFEQSNFTSQRIAYYAGLREQQITGKTFDMPELEGIIFVETEPGHMYLGTQKKVVRFDEMKGVLIRCN